MLILPPDHAANLQTLRRLTGREKWLIRGVLAVLAVLAVGLAIALATAGKTSARGCIHLTVPGPVGAGTIDECGASARDTCGSALRPGAFAPAVRPEVAAACRKAGLPVG